MSRLPVLHLRLVHLLLFYLHVIQGVIILSDTHQSRNVSAGTLVEFTCATPETGLTSFTLTPEITLGNTMEMMLPNGDRQLTLSFIAPSEYQKLTISCVATRENNINTSAAVLMIQGPLAAVGNLTSSEVDNCTLHFTWTAPYTLQGVPINYYTINITRHSNGTVLRSDTTNTTEYLYTVSSLGETLEVVVAAVNGAGTGNVSSIIAMTQPPSFKFSSSSVAMNRDNNDWTFHFYQKDLMCEHALDGTVLVKACLDSFCVNASGNLNSANSMRSATVTFTNLEENSKYNATVQVRYNGGVVQQSQPVEISTFDVQNVTVVKPVVEEQVCLNIYYVNGHQSNKSFVVFKCSTTGNNMHNDTITGESGCVNVVPNQFYDILITDMDAEEEILTTPAFIITGVFVPNDTQYLTTTASITNTPSVTPTSSSQLDSSVAIIVAGVLSAVVTALIVVVIVFVLSCVTKRILYQRIWNYRASKSPNIQHHHQESSLCVQLVQAPNEDLTYATVTTSNITPVCTPVPADIAGRSEYGTVLTTVGEQRCIECLDHIKKLELGHSSVLQFLFPLSSMWYQLGEAIGIQEDFLDKIKINNHTDDKCLEMVLYYWEQNLDYNWETLLHALSSSQVNAPCLAVKVMDKLNEPLDM